MHRLSPLAALFFVTFASTATADSRDPVAAEALFREGRRAIEAGDVAHACPKFVESLRLDPASGTRLNLADCDERMGRIAAAWHHFARVADELPEQDDRRPLAASRAAALEKRLPRLTIVLGDPSTRGIHVLRDEVELGPPSFGVAIPLDPGPHKVVVLAPGRAPRHYAVQMVEGRTERLEVHSGPPDEHPPQHGAPVKTVGLAVGAFGVLSLGAGAYFGVRALSARSDSDDICTAGVCRDARGVDAYDDAQAHARIADVSLCVGAVALVVATYLVLTAPAPRPRDKDSVAFVVTPGGVYGRW